MHIKSRLKQMGLFLPAAPALPLGHTLQFAWARSHGNLVYLSGHAAQMPDGSFAPIRGKVDAEVTLEDAQQAARQATLSLLGSLQREIGDLDRVAAWLNVSGMVQVAAGFTNTTAIIDG